MRKVGINEHPSPDGGIESTVVDVQRFYRALFYSNKLLKNSDAINRHLFAMDGSHWGAYGGGQGISAAAEVDLDTSYEIVVLANTDHLVAERISGRIHSYIKNGEYQPIRQLEKTLPLSTTNQKENNNSINTSNRFMKTMVTVDSSAEQLMK